MALNAIRKMPRRYQINNYSYTIAVVQAELGLQFVFNKLFNTSDIISWHSMPKKIDGRIKE